MVRRDWCPLSKDVGNFALREILSAKPKEDVVAAIHDHLNKVCKLLSACTDQLADSFSVAAMQLQPCMLSMRIVTIWQWCCTCKLCVQTSRQYSLCYYLAVPSANKESTGSKHNKEDVPVAPVQHLMLMSRSSK